MWTLAGGLGVILLVLFFHASALVVFSEILCCGLSVKAQDYAFLAKANVVLFWLTERVHDHIGAMVHRMLRI